MQILDQAEEGSLFYATCSKHTYTLKNCGVNNVPDQELCCLFSLERWLIIIIRIAVKKCTNIEFMICVSVQPQVLQIFAGPVYEVHGY